MATAGELIRMKDELIQTKKSDLNFGCVEESETHLTFQI